ncbi:45588_t:CDS:2, partial [Gigaspora margarita]
MLEIGALRQDIYESVPLFWAKIQKYGDQLGYTLAQKKTHFLSGVRPDIRDEIYRIGQTKPINDIIDSLAELELRHGILQQASLQPCHASISPAIPDAISQQPVFPIADMQKMIQNIFAKEQAESKAEIEKLKTELQAQQPQVATVGNFKLPPKIYPIKSEKPQQAFYIVDQEDNYMDPLAQDPNYYKYLEQAKALLKKPQQQNQNTRMDRIESKVDEIGQMTSQFGRMILDNQSKKPVAKSNSTYRYFPPLIPSQSQCASSDSDEDDGGILDSNKNQLRIKLHGKSYIILTFSKVSEVSQSEDAITSSEPEQQVSDIYNALFTSIQSVSEMIERYNNLQAQYDNLLAELENAQLRRDLNQADTDKKKLSKHAFQLIDEVKRLRVDNTNLTSQIAQSQISHD